MRFSKVSSIAYYNIILLAGVAIHSNMYAFYEGLRHAFDIICKEAGIPNNTSYSGRRTFISSLIDKNVSIKTIQGYVGHKDSRTTLNNYNFDRSKKEEQSRQLTEARLSLSLSDITESVGFLNK